MSYALIELISGMDPMLILGFIALYFIVLFSISRLTSKGSNNQDFFVAGNKAPWYLVAFGMIGASLSGVTFISIPGWVDGSQFSYMQMVLGYILGYVVIAYVLIPVYYKLGLISIYTYLKDRFGHYSYKTGAIFFLVSRTLGAGIRLLLVANVLQYLIFENWGVPFAVTVLLSIGLIWLYTHKGGLKTIIWTDTLQTAFMLISLGLTIYFIAQNLELVNPSEVYTAVKNSQYSQVFFFDNILAKNHFLKHFFGGMFIAIGMTGLDQDMMQKNLSCKSARDAQKNIMSFTVVLVFVNLLFLSLGALLYMYATNNGITVPVLDGAKRTDLLFSDIALNSGLGVSVAVFFMLGLIAAAYSSADSALTSLTTSVSIDILEIDKKTRVEQEKIRKQTHVVMSIILFVVILILNESFDRNAIFQIIFLAGFTYGPLIGLYAFGFMTKRSLSDRLVPVVCISAVLITLVLWLFSSGGAVGLSAESALLGGYVFGAELIILNAVLTFLGLFGISKKALN
ncbi:MAG: sodium:solute symporter [Flavobacteriales bacterium]